jgi:hypothetical protein
MSDNSTKQISDGVIRKAILGSYGCPQPRTDLGFPEPYLANNEIVKKINELENSKVN